MAGGGRGPRGGAGGVRAGVEGAPAGGRPGRPEPPHLRRRRRQPGPPPLTASPPGSEAKLQLQRRNELQRVAKIFTCIGRCWKISKKS